MKMNRWIACALCAATLCFSAVGCLADETLAPNEFIGENAHGAGGAIRVKVTMDGDKIADIKTVEQHETRGLGTTAIMQLTQDMLAANSTEVDDVSGATLTSVAFKAAVRQAVETAKETLYSFDQLKTNKSEPRRPLRKMVFNVPTRRELTSGERAIQHGLAIAAGIKAAKDLGNMPPNICNAAYLASQARQLADSYSKNVITRVIGEQQMKELGMHSYLAVGQGSQNESLMSVIEYKGNASEDARPIVLVGKGLTFDSGGISIKPSEGMDEMKYDMCGAAAVYGVMRMVAELQLPINVIGVLAGCENMPGGRAYRPGDVLTTMSGQTVEVLNTDAEGRLVLCDVLTYVERFEPEAVIDVATLTGACVIALGHHITGLMANHNPLAHELIAASEQSGDRAWRLPLGDEYQEQLESNFADMANIGGRPGGAITAGCFLSRFTRKYNWAHLDIAGTAWRSGKAKGATGRPVALLAQFLLNRAGFNGEE